MTIVYSIDSEHQLVQVKMSGETNAEEIEAYSERLLADPAYRPEYNTLTDMRDTSSVLSSAEVRRIASKKAGSRELLSGTRRAVVVPSDVAYGMMRMFEGLTGGADSPFRTFRSMEEALIWLGMDGD